MIYNLFPEGQGATLNIEFLYLFIRTGLSVSYEPQNRRHL